MYASAFLIYENGYDIYSYFIGESIALDNSVRLVSETVLTVISVKDQYMKNPYLTCTIKLILY